MFRLSIWANRHPVLTRLFIFLAHVTIGILGLEGGLLLWADGLHLPPLAFYVPLALYLAAYLAYPVAKQSIWTSIATFRRRKWLDFSLFISMALMWLVAGNLLPAKIGPAIAGGPAAQTTIAIGMLPASREHAPNMVKKTRTIGKKISDWAAKRIQKKLDRYKNKSGDKAGWIVLGVLLTILLAAATAIGACGLACNGNDTAAVMVVILGGGLIALTWILIAKRLSALNAGYSMEKPPAG